MSRPICMDFDDLASTTMSKLDLVCKLKQAMPALEVTLFAIPAKLTDDDIRAAKSLGPWVHLGMHGWAHTLGECWSWAQQEAEDKMKMALDRGIDARVFRAPRWVIDAETYRAAKALDWVIADHKDYRVIGSGARVYTYNKALRNPPATRVHGHLPDIGSNGIAEAYRTFIFPPTSTFTTIPAIAEIG